MDRLILQKNVIRLYDIITYKPKDGRYGGRYNSQKSDAYKLLIDINNNENLGPNFSPSKSSCGKCAKKFILSIKKLIEKWQIEKK